MKRSRTALRKKCVDLAKKIAKTRDGYVCQKCARTKAEGWQIHGSHIMPETYHATCAYPENIIALCASCHTGARDSWHQEPISNARWFEERWPGRYDRLREKALAYVANPFPKLDWDSELTSLKEIAKEYGL